MNRNDISGIASLILLCSSAVTLIAMQLNYGWILLFAGMLMLCFCERKFAKEMLLVFLGLAILGITPITTDISYMHFVTMGVTLMAAIAVPYIISRYIYCENIIKFNIHHGRGWYKSEVLYILVTAATSYFLLPFYLKSTGAYLNWPAVSSASETIRLFIGTNALGIWDELFFVCTVFWILRRHWSLILANTAQSILFTSFLFELGFTGWAPLVIFPFAFAQGYIFMKTDSLLYVISIHLTLDFILFLALLNAHNPGMAAIFPY